jgi:adenylosuccinate synthase
LIALESLHKVRILIPLQTRLKIDSIYRINLTKLDILDSFETIQVATAYEVDGELLHSFPSSHSLASRAKVKYTTFSGWQKPITGINRYDKLPLECKAYVEFIEKFIGVKVTWIGTGPERRDMIVR